MAGRYVTISDDIARLQAGDVYTLPDGDVIGNITLPRGLSGSPGQFIHIVGGKDTRIIATDNTLPAFGGGGCKWLRISGFATVGGRDGVAISQNGAEYDPAKMIEQVYIRNVTAINPVNDGIKLNGGRQAHVHSCTVRGGGDQGIDLLGIDNGSVRLCDVSGSPCGVVIKGGSRRIVVSLNRVTNCKDGLHIGERTAPEWQAPWTQWSAENVVAVDNDISVTGNPIVTFQFHDADASILTAGNKLTTTKIARGQIAPLVEVY